MDPKLIISFENDVVKFHDRHSALRNQGFHLYDLGKDPNEKEDLSYRYPKKVKHLKEKILNWYPFDVESRILPH